MSALSTLYGRLPLPMRSVAISAYGCYLAWVRYGGAYEAERKALDDSEHLEAGQMLELQNRELRKLLQLATTHSPYFRALDLDVSGIDVSSIGARVPILSKLEFRQRQADIEVHLRELGKTTRINTSGTTGTPINILVTRQAIRRNYAFFARFLSWAGVSVRDRSATFSGRTLIREDQSEPPFWLFNAATNTMHYSSYHISKDTSLAYLRSLERLRPAYIDSYPSAIYALAKAQLDSGHEFEVRPKAIVTSSETLLQHQREAIERAFDCRVFDQYGSAEMAGFISQCESGSYHVHPEYGIVEIVDPDGHPSPVGTDGRLILTGFVNPVTPLIRYEIGDIATAAGDACECGRAFPVVGAIAGRKDDLIKTPDGRSVGRLDPVFKGVTGILESQIVQDRIDRIRVLVVPATSGPIPEQSTRALSTALRARLGPEMQIDIERVDNIPRTRAGKFRAVVSHIDDGR